MTCACGDGCRCVEPVSAALKHLIAAADGKAEADRAYDRALITARGALRLDATDQESDDAKA